MQQMAQKPQSHAAAKRAAQQLVQTMDELQSTVLLYPRVHYDVFQVLVLQKRNLAEASAAIKRSCEAARRV